MSSALPTRAPNPAAYLAQAREGFLRRFSELCRLTGRSDSNLSRHLFGAPDRIDEIRNGSHPRVDTLARAEAELARLAAEAGVCLDGASVRALVDKPDSVAVGERQ
jgi:hypothetical protein